MKKIPLVLLLILLIVPFPTHAALPLGIEACWSMNENSGAPADLTTKGRNLTNVNTTPFVAGKVYNGADLEKLNINHFTRTNNFDYTAGSISMLINPESVTDASESFPLISTSNNASLQGFQIAINRISSKVMAYFGAAPTEVGSPTALVRGTWYHVFFPRSTSDKILYINGLREARNTTAETMTAGIATLHVGDDALAQDFDGIIDEVIIYSRQITDGEVTALYNAGAGRGCRDTLTAFPAFFWDF